MDIAELHRTIEAIIFASGEPVSVKRIAQVIELDEETTLSLCNGLADRIKSSDTALLLLKTDDQFQFVTKSEYAPYIRSALEMRRNAPLSNAAMEVLAIIAYNEPVTRNLVERVRGVDCSGVISSLLAKGLIEEKGRLDLPGRPMQYKTSSLFLRCFGMESLAQLPKLPGDTSESDFEGQMVVDDFVDMGDAAASQEYADEYSEDSFGE